MRTVYKFFRPTLPKLIFTAEWAAYVLIMTTGGQLSGLRQWMAALWPLLLFYCLGCVLVAWSQRTDRVASGRRLALLIVTMIALDQISKTVTNVLLPPGATLPLVKGWLHLTNVHNITGSWFGPAWFKFVLAVVAVLVLPLSVIVYRYYIFTKRKSLWVDLTLLSILVGYTSWLCDMLLRGYTLDFILLPGVVAIDFKDMCASLGGASAIIEMLDNPHGVSLRWEGWRVELESTRQIITDISTFAARDLRSWWAAVWKKPGPR
jgi:lipoprotein signal peptidase